MTDTSTLDDLLASARTWLDQAAVHHNNGEMSLAASAARIGSGYSYLVGAHGVTVELSATHRARADRPEHPDPAPRPLAREPFPESLRSDSNQSRGPKAPSVTTEAAEATQEGSG